MKKRRENKFLNAFPDAVDIIVRGVKAGLPLLDCLKMITIEAPEPLKSEFRAIVETQAIGMPLGDACGKLYEHMPVPEANFFGIVISIQQKAGGNLSEALGNLSRVLRDRKKMKAKIQAMSKEAKASASIIGALPVAVMTLVYITSPHYISLLLWTEPLGRVMLAGSAVWMSMGVLVMKKMINFDFLAHAKWTRKDHAPGKRIADARFLDRLDQCQDADDGVRRHRRGRDGLDARDALCCSPIRSASA